MIQQDQIFECADYHCGVLSFLPDGTVRQIYFISPTFDDELSLAIRKDLIWKFRRWCDVRGLGMEGNAFCRKRGVVLEYPRVQEAT